MCPASCSMATSSRIASSDWPSRALNRSGLPRKTCRPFHEAVACPGERLERFDLRRCNALIGHKFHHGSGERMLAGALQSRGHGQHVAFAHGTEEANRRDLGLAVSQRAGLVYSQHAYARQPSR